MEKDFPSFEAMLRYDAALGAMLQGLRLEYIRAITEGRVDKWAAAAHAIIDLVAVVPPLVARKSDEGEQASRMAALHPAANAA